MARGTVQAVPDSVEEEAVVEEAAAPKTEQDLKREAYSAAQSRLRVEFKKDYDRIVGEEMKARGIDWAPRLTEEEKAAKQMADLLAQFPSLREQAVSQPAE